MKKKTYLPDYKKETKVKKTKNTQKKRNQSSQPNVNSNSSFQIDLYNAKCDIDTILLHLNDQTDPDMIDCYTYQLKGAYMRYRFLLKQIKEPSG